MKNPHRYGTDVIIVGGGISGLYAAQKCILQGFSVMVLEKSKHLGGRIHTIYKDGYHYEAGAGRFSSNHHILRRLLHQHHLTEVPNSKRYQYNEHPSPVQSILKQLMRLIQNVPEEELMRVSFRQLCERLLGREKTNLLIYAFGYNAEFDLANAYTAVSMFNRDFMSRTYFSCKEGYGELIRRMEHFIATHKAPIFKATTVHKVDQKATHCIVHAIDGNGVRRAYHCKAVICAIPKKELECLEQFDANQRELLNKVTPVSLHRIYGQFPAHPKPWFSNVFRTSTNDSIRQFIPMNKKHGVAMISYSDTRYADYWKRQADKGDEHLKKEVLKHLHAVFPSIPKIHAPEWIESHYWSEGVHLWKPGTNVDDVMPKIQHIAGEGGRVFVAGEAYSKIQGWIEGALESVDTVFPAVSNVVLKYL